MRRMIIHKQYNIKYLNNMTQKPEKSIDEYKKNIYTLKTRINQQEKAIELLKQQFSSYNVLEDLSYEFKIKSKILQLSIAELNNKERKFMKHEARNIYSLNFAILKLLKSCQILSVTPEMIFRGIDKKMEKAVSSSDFSYYLKDTFQLPMNSINILIQTLDNRKNQGKIKLQAYDYLLQCFLIKKQEKISKESAIQNAYYKFLDLIIKNKIIIDSFWKEQKMDIGEFVYQIINQIKQLNILEGIAIFTRFDPSKSGLVQKRQVIYQIKQKLQDIIKDKKIILKK